MIKNYIKIAWRNLSRNKRYAFINIAGLAVALAVFMVIIFYIRHETSYDQFLPESELVYRVLMKNNASNLTHAGTPMGLPSHMEEVFPEVTYGAKANIPSSYQYLIEHGDKQFYQNRLTTASEDFFRIFKHEFVYGTPENSLTEPNTIVLSENLSQKIFGMVNPVGETVTVNKDREYSVTGVVKNPPSKTHLKFSGVFQYREREMRSWRYSTYPTYLKLTKNSVQQLQEKLSSYIQLYADYGENTDLSEREMLLQPLSEVYLYPEGREAGSDKMIYIGIFFTVALLILLIACVNYINLATARSMERAREIGVRKSVGATRWQIIQQVISETLITCSLSFLLALVLVEVSLPWIQAYFNLDLGGMSWMNPAGIAILLSVLIGVALLSGTYSAFYLSSFSPKQVFQGQRNIKRYSAATLRKGLVVAQFTISLVVIVATVLISRQMNYIQETRLNGEDSQILLINNNSDVIDRQFNLFRQELLQNTSIAEVATGNMIGQPGMTMELAEDSLNIPNRMQWLEGSHEYLEALGMDLQSGRYLNSEITGDSSENVLMNESAASLFGVERAHGQFVPKPVSANVVGIVEDFHDQTFYEQITPTVIRYGGESKRYIYVRLRKGQISRGLQQARETWDAFQTGYPFDYIFLDQELDSRYRSELQMARIFSGFAGFSIFIACLGLFGLAAFSARRRTREIGIRKVLGATVSNIVTLLSREFLLLVGLGFLISIPIALYGVNRWLQNFAYRIEVGPMVFVVVGAVVLLIALLTVSWQSIRAALANPVDSLRSE